MTEATLTFSYRRLGNVIERELTEANKEDLYQAGVGFGKIPTTEPVYRVTGLPGEVGILEIFSQLRRAAIVPQRDVAWDEIKAR